MTAQFELVEREDGTIEVKVMAPCNDNCPVQDDGDPSLLIFDPIVNVYNG